MPNRCLGSIAKYVLSATEAFRQYLFDLSMCDDEGKSDELKVHYSVELRNTEKIRISRRSTIKQRCIIDGRTNVGEFGVDIGEDVYLKEGCYIDSYGGMIVLKGKSAFAQNTYMHGGGGIEIGVNVIAGPNCSFIASNHIYSDDGLPIMLQGDVVKGIVVKNNVWIGAGSVILDGVTIGKNVVIGAGSIVNRSVPDNSRFVNKITSRVDTIYR